MADAMEADEIADRMTKDLLDLLKSANSHIYNRYVSHRNENHAREKNENKTDTVSEEVLDQFDDNGERYVLIEDSDLNVPASKKPGPGKAAAWCASREELEEVFRAMEEEGVDCTLEDVVIRLNEDYIASPVLVTADLRDIAVNPKLKEIFAKYDKDSMCESFNQMLDDLRNEESKIEPIVDMPEPDFSNVFELDFKTVSWDREGHLLSCYLEKAGIWFDVGPSRYSPENLTFIFCSNQAEKVRELIDNKIAHIKGMNESRFPNLEALDLAASSTQKIDMDAVGHIRIEDAEEARFFVEALSSQNIACEYIQDGNDGAYDIYVSAMELSQKAGHLPEVENFIKEVSYARITAGEELCPTGFDIAKTKPRSESVKMRKDLTEKHARPKPKELIEKTKDIADKAKAVTPDLTHSVSRGRS